MKAQIYISAHEPDGSYCSFLAAHLILNPDSDEFFSDGRPAWYANVGMKFLLSMSVDSVENLESSARDEYLEFWRRIAEAFKMDFEVNPEVYGEDDSSPAVSE